MRDLVDNRDDEEESRSAQRLEFSEAQHDRLLPLIRDLDGEEQEDADENLRDRGDRIAGRAGERGSRHQDEEQQQADVAHVASRAAMQMVLLHGVALGARRRSLFFFFFFLRPAAFLLASDRDDHVVLLRALSARSTSASTRSSMGTPCASALAMNRSRRLLTALRFSRARPPLARAAMNVPVPCCVCTIPRISISR